MKEARALRLSRWWWSCVCLTVYDLGRRGTARISGSVDDIREMFSKADKRSWLVMEKCETGSEWLKLKVDMERRWIMVMRSR